MIRFELTPFYRMDTLLNFGKKIGKQVLKATQKLDKAQQLATASIELLCRLSNKKPKVEVKARNLSS